MERSLCLLHGLCRMVTDSTLPSAGPGGWVSHVLSLVSSVLCPLSSALCPLSAVRFQLSSLLSPLPPSRLSSTKHQNNWEREERRAASRRGGRTRGRATKEMTRGSHQAAADHLFDCDVISLIWRSEPVQRTHTRPSARPGRLGRSTPEAGRPPCNHRDQVRGD